MFGNITHFDGTMSAALAVAILALLQLRIWRYYAHNLAGQVRRNRQWISAGVVKYRAAVRRRAQLQAQLDSYTNDKRDRELKDMRLAKMDAQWECLALRDRLKESERMLDGAERRPLPRTECHVGYQADSAVDDSLGRALADTGLRGVYDKDVLISRIPGTVDLEADTITDTMDASPRALRNNSNN